MGRLGGGGYGLVRCVPRAWTHLLAEAVGHPVDPGSPIPEPGSRRCASAGLRTPPPRRMTELDAPAEGIRWQRGSRVRHTPLSRAITATRRAVFPLHGLDPDDPRD